MLHSIATAKTPFASNSSRRIGEDGPPPPSLKPYYEQVGEARVRSGLYASVLRYGSHVRPVIDALLAAVEPSNRHATDLRTLHE